MISDDRGRSLADEAASWVPPWDRAAPADAASTEAAPADAPPAEAAAGEEAASDEAERDEAERDEAERDEAERDEAKEPGEAAELGEAEEAQEPDVAEETHGAHEADGDRQTEEAAEPSGGPPEVRPQGEASFDAAFTDTVLPKAVLPDRPASDRPASDGAASDRAASNGAASDWAFAAGPPGESQPEDQAAAPLALVADEELRGALEAILLVVEEPVDEVTLAQVLEQPTERIIALLSALVEEYESTGRGFELRRAAGGWRLYTRPEYAQYVERFVLDGQQLRLTQAALETLAVVAYKQPVTRSRISAIRGVNCDGVIRTLISRGLVEECGAEPDSGAFLYRTTNLFLEKLGLNSVEELPPLAPFLPDDVDEITDAPR